MMKTNKKRLPGFVALAVVCLSLFILAGIVHADDPPVLTSISITPQNPTMTVGESLTFTATGYDQYGDSFPLNDPQWSADTTYGTLTVDPQDPTKATFTATSPGVAGMMCGEGGTQIAGSNEITIAQDSPVLTSISITPYHPTMTVGESLTFTATGYDQYGDPFPLNDPQWWANPQYGTLTVDPQDPTKATFTATAAGIAGIMCEEGGTQISGSTEITITEGGELVRIEVTPTEVTLMVGHQQQFVAKGYDENNNEVPIDPIWSTTGGTITSDGLYTATEVGDFTVTASVEGSTVTGTATVHVKQESEVARIVVYPRRAILYYGQKQQFKAKGYDKQGNEVPIVPVWNATGGTITQQGLYTAGNRVGVFVVVARVKGSTVIGYTRVIIRPLLLKKVVVTPKRVKLYPGQQQQFSAVGYDISGNPVPITPIWRIWKATGSTITQQGLFTAGFQDGYYVVIVRAKGSLVTATATVHVTKP